MVCLLSLPNSPTETPPVATPAVDVGTQYTVLTDEELEKPYRVIIENDDVTPMDFVTLILQMFFGLTFERSQHVMLEAHYEGEAYVGTYPYNEAYERVYEAHSIARAEGYPLTFHLEPDE